MAFEDISLDSLLAVEKETEKENENPFEDLNLEKEEDKQEDKKEEEEKKEEESDNKEEEEKEEEKEDEDEDESEPLIKSLVKNISEDLELENLNPDDYTDDDEGFKKLLKDSARVAAEKQINNWFSQDDLLKKHAEYLLKGGDSKKFLETFYPKQIVEDELTEQNDSVQEAYLKEFFAIKGFSKEEAEEFIKDFDVAGQKFTRAKNAKEAIDAYREKQKEELLKEQEKTIQLQQQKAAETWNEIQETVSKDGVVKNFKIKDSEKKAFLDYISKPVDRNGKTQRQIDAEKADLETRLLIDYLMFNKLNISNLVLAKEETARARALRKNVADQSKPTPKGGNKGTSGYSKKVNFDELDFNKIFNG